MMHIPVLLKEVIDVLDPKPGEFFIDGTLGAGGHAKEIIKKISPGGIFLGIDWDEKAISNAKRESQIANRKNLILIQGNYADTLEILSTRGGSAFGGEKNKLPKADGMLVDLGLSSDQLEESGRGFSFQKDEPLDMRYDARINSDFDADKRGYISVDQRNNRRISAAEVINNFSEKDLADIFWKYGEERFSRKIADKIVETRRKKPIRTSAELAEIVKSAFPKYRGKIHPATRVFQALRIYVNGELDNLEKLLKNSGQIMESGGRLAIISFHSLEDRLVKNYFREMAKNGVAEILTKKPITPTKEEINNNKRSRSAKLRAIKISF